MGTRTIAVGSSTVGECAPTYIIAEMSANHLGSLDRAHQIVEAAAKAGANAIKLQTYTADTITIDCDNKYFQITQGTIWDGTTLHKLYEEAYTPWDWQPELKAHAEELGMDCFSTPFDPSSVEFLESIDVPAYKIASFEITDIPLLKMIARLGKPVIISTGIARLEDIDLAVRACREEGNDQIALLKCSSAYPSPYEDINLRTIPNLAETFHVVAGLSDHTLGYEVAIAGVSLGAKIVEKHLTLSRADGGPDSAFSMEPEEFSDMVNGIRNVERALGDVTYELTPKQIKSREHCRSLFVVKPISAGEMLTKDNVRSIRPGFGLAPIFYDQVLGRVAKHDIAAGTPLAWDLLG
jgi:pseudaminic acid synthase